MERTEIEKKWISKIKLSWTGSPTTADGLVHRNYKDIDKFASQQSCSEKSKISF